MARRGGKVWTIRLRDTIESAIAVIQSRLVPIPVLGKCYQAQGLFSAVLFVHMFDVVDPVAEGGAY